MIKAKGLTFHYPGRRSPAARNLTFYIIQGEIFRFLGPSGAGVPVIAIYHQLCSRIFIHGYAHRPFNKAVQKKGLSLI